MSLTLEGSQKFLSTGLLIFGLANHPSAGPAPSLDRSLFVDGSVHRIQLTISSSDLNSLRTTPRDYVRATLRAGTNQLRDVAVRLKGSIGSFRPIDDKPAFTVDCDQFVPGQQFHALSKFHLNNSVEDPSYLHEQLGSELFRAANLPAPRVAHALVELNGRRLGLYVLKEGFNREFLERSFSSANGNLYEAEAGAGFDVDEPLKLNSSAGIQDRSELQRLVDATREPDLDKRWIRLGESLDLDRFVRFMAIEVLLGHRDGYCLARNNFRIYHDPTSDRLVFLPDGMDQLFGSAQVPIRPHMAGMVARAMMETPSGRQAYVRSVTNLLTSGFTTDRLTHRIRQLAATIGPQLPRNEAKAFTRESTALCERIRRRVIEVERQLTLPEPVPIRFENGVARVGGWHPVDAPAGGKLEQLTATDGEAWLSIVAGTRTSASWRAQVRLRAGRYRFEASASTRVVTPLGFGNNNGAFLGVTGRKVSDRQHLSGTRDWTPLQVEFEVAEPETDVELVCALRANSGEARFKVGSLRLTRLEEPIR